MALWLLRAFNLPSNRSLFELTTFIWGVYQASLKYFVPASANLRNVCLQKNRIYNGWPDANLDEKCLQKFEMWDSVPASARRSHRLMSPGIYLKYPEVIQL